MIHGRNSQEPLSVVSKKAMPKLVWMFMSPGMVYQKEIVHANEENKINHNEFGQQLITVNLRVYVWQPNLFLFFGLFEDVQRPRTKQSFDSSFCGTYVAQQNARQDIQDKKRSYPNRWVYNLTSPIRHLYFHDSSRLVSTKIITPYTPCMAIFSKARPLSFLFIPHADISWDSHTKASRATLKGSHCVKKVATSCGAVFEQLSLKSNPST